MSQSEFFNALGAPQKNVRWSWGAVRPLDGAVFLKVWLDQFKTYDGKRYVQITFGTKSTKPGRSERFKHVALIESKAPSFLVICEAHAPEITPRSIKRIEKDFVYRGGTIGEIEGNKWIEVGDEVPFSEAKRTHR